MSQHDLFQAVRSTNPLEETITRVTGAIQARLLSPGDRLPAERELATQLGVSRSTLRVALQSLTTAGWLEVRRGRHGGSFVARWPRFPQARKLPEVLRRYRDSLPEMLDYRRAVESTAAALAAERATPNEIDHLAAINASLVEQSNFEAIRTIDTRFHVTIARAAHSPRILQAVTEIHSALSEVLDVIMYETAEDHQNYFQQHQDILESIRTHNAECAQHFMLDHVRETANLIVGLAQSPSA